jgi:Calcineurin-like phosphoesterase
MPFELWTFLRWSWPGSDSGRDHRGRYFAAAVLASSLATSACDGDTAQAAAGGAPGYGDGAIDGILADRSGGSAGGRAEGGSSDAPERDDVAGEASLDVAPETPRQDVQDDGRDANEEPVDPPRDAADVSVSIDAADVSDDGPVDVRPDVPRDSSPIVVGPPFWRSVRFAVFGDYGVASTDEARVSNLVHSWNPDFIITTGDNDYTANIDGIDAVIGRYYSDFIGNYWGAYGPGSRTTRFWPSPGNHDWDNAHLSAYTDYFTLPGNERYYDIGLGLVHLFALDSDPREPDGTTADSVQARWLQSRLSQSTSCFNIVYFHHPAYSSGPHGSSFDMRWPFEQWGADVVLYGHDHVYERFEVGQIPHFTVGLGGASPYSFVTTLPETRAQYNSDFGALRVTAHRRGIRFEFINAGGTLIDSFFFRKRCN